MAPAKGSSVTRKRELAREARRMLNFYVELQSPRTRAAHRLADEEAAMFLQAAQLIVDELTRMGATECGHCGERINFLGAQWTADDGTTVCTDTSAPHAPHKPKED